MVAPAPLCNEGFELLRVLRDQPLQRAGSEMPRIRRRHMQQLVQQLHGVVGALFDRSVNLFPGPEVLVGRQTVRPIAAGQRMVAPVGVESIMPLRRRALSVVPSIRAHAAEGNRLVPTRPVT